MFANCYNYTKETKNMYPEYEKIEGKKGFSFTLFTFPRTPPKRQHTLWRKNKGIN